MPPNSLHPWSHRNWGRGDRGGSFVEYGGVVLLIAAVAAVLFAGSIPERAKSLYASGLCSIQSADGGSADCADPANGEEPGGTDAAGNSTQPGDEEEVRAPAPAAPPEDRGFTPHEQPEGYPAPEHFEAVTDDVTAIREYFDEDDSLLPCIFDCPDDPEEIFAGMSAEEINAAYWALTDEELERLLDDPETREVILLNADLETLRRIREIDPDLVEPDLDDVGGDDANEEDGNPTDDLGFATLPKGRLWGDDGEVSMDHVNQGGLGNCWLLAGMGAVAEKHPELIKDMITENENKTFTVTFPDTGEQVTVTPDVVVNEINDPAFSTPQDNVLWPAILEKAYAEREGSFGETEGGFASNAMEMITGNDSKTYDDVEEITEDDLAGLVNGRRTAVTFATPPRDEAEGELYDLKPHEGGLAPGHAYIVREVKDGKVSLYNPWGTSHVTMTIEQFHEHISYMDINTYDS
ncbi:hypothetical protein GCM10009799_31270 [Nocardiopsis rhodophaea]|uniref:Calpain catalytic domain-containing protein n=1 Tax=Nocardiopsis rhodophaea TaxID=280238 RepID=A0ABP5EPU2_9ACTN